MCNHLRRRRRELEISQYDLAVRVEMGRDRYCRIEKGYTPPTEAERGALAEALDTTVEALFPTPEVMP